MPRSSDLFLSSVQSGFSSLTLLEAASAVAQAVDWLYRLQTCELARRLFGSMMMFSEDTTATATKATMKTMTEN